mmetsp:Transcript_127332/g.254371  ORF Transcript_127332/g.254371 Transcript_127332/m.254371 type:complete len:239 (-) Transcript_127332:209-925(-)
MLKSMTCIRSDPSSNFDSKMFSRDRSLWTMENSCSCCKAAIICLARGCTNTSRSTPGAQPDSHQENKSPSVAKLVTTYVCTSSRYTPSREQTYGKSMPFKKFTHPTSCHGISVSDGCSMTKSEWLLRIHLFGICFTATSLPLLLSLMRCTCPRFRVASCNFLTISKRPGSHRLTVLGSNAVWSATGAFLPHEAFGTASSTHIAESVIGSAVVLLEGKALPWSKWSAVWCADDASASAL